jgi:hypothetical protein
MKLLKAAIATMGASALLIGAMAAPALADQKVPLYGGDTQVTTAAGVLQNLTARGITMTPRAQATSVRVEKAGTIRQQFTFPITTPSFLTLEDNAITGEVGSIIGGKVVHRGGIKFTHTHNGNRVAVGGFVVNLNKGKVFATWLNGDKVDPIAIFKIVQVDPPLYPVYNQKVDPTKATVRGLNLYLTPGAATLLNDTLKVQAFDSSVLFASAVTKADLTS